MSMNRVLPDLEIRFPPPSSDAEMALDRELEQAERQRDEAERLLLAMVQESPVSGAHDEGQCNFCHGDAFPLPAEDEKQHAPDCDWIAARRYLVARGMLPSEGTMSALIEHAQEAIADDNNGIVKVESLRGERLRLTGRHPTATSLARFAVAVAEALPGLRVKHFGDCDAVDWNQAERKDAGLSPAPCTCGADTHNATLDRLRAMLEDE